MLRALVLFISLTLPLHSCFADAQSMVVKDGYVEAQLIAEALSIGPGNPFWIALRLKMDPGWHTYWKSPGDSGTPTKIKWTIPEGFKTSPIEWPYPHRIEQPPLTGYGYEDEVFLLTKIETPDSLPLGTITIKAKVDWLMCQVGCIPGKAELEIQLPVSHKTPRENTPWIKNFKNTQALPLEHNDWTVKAHSAEHLLILELLYPDAEQYPLSNVYFFPERDDLINHADSQKLNRIKGGYELTINRSILTTKTLTKIKGVLYSKEGWRGPGTEHALAVNVPVESTLVPMPSLKTLLPSNNLTLLNALIFAFLGGLILNLMPCVLPVLSLKVLSFIKQGGADKTKIRMHGLIFTLGVLASFWLLAGLLILLRAGGEQIGWGFQFQSPGFLVFLSLVFFIFALNLFGLFEITLPFQVQGPSRNPGLTGAFFNGVLATITATPCTAPFMGSALGFALSQSPLVSLGIFTSLGLGMSFPYLLLSFVPSFLKFLPKPGPWMNTFKKFLGVLLLGTVLWLGWVLAIQLGILKDKPSSSFQIQWQPYSPELIQQLRSEKKLILIDFTAKWCLSCQVNEKVALDNAKVVKRLKELGVATVKADWTLQDMNITQALAQYGKNSIPLYVLYSRDPSKAPMILPEIITPKIVLDALDKLHS